MGLIMYLLAPRWYHRLLSKTTDLLVNKKQREKPIGSLIKVGWLTGINIHDVFESQPMDSPKTLVLIYFNKINAASNVKCHFACEMEAITLRYFVKFSWMINED